MFGIAILRKHISTLVVWVFGDHAAPWVFTSLGAAVRIGQKRTTTCILIITVSGFECIGPATAGVRFRLWAGRYVVCMVAAYRLLHLLRGT